MKICIGRISLQVAFVILAASALAPALGGQDQSPKDSARQIIRSFQEGVEAGDKKLGPLLASKDFAASFVPFYDLLADVYSKNHDVQVVFNGSECTLTIKKRAK